MKVLASDFASLSDLAAYRAAKNRGATEEQALALGDNGIGCWGDITAQEQTPMCALPPEDWLTRWHSGPSARGKQVLVTNLANNQQIICLLADTMPHKAAITNGCGIDLNPAALKTLAWTTPIKNPVNWEWAQDQDQHYPTPNTKTQPLTLLQKIKTLFT